MTTVRDLIKRSLRSIGVLAGGREPNASEAADALAILNAARQSLFGQEIGYGPLYPVRLTAATLTARNGVVYQAGFVASQISLPADPNEGMRVGVTDAKAALATYPVTVLGNGRTIEGLTSVALNTAGARAEWFFRADTGNWERRRDLALNDEPDLPPDLHEALVNIAAVRIALEYGIPDDPRRNALSDQGRELIARRYGRRARVQTDPARSARAA